MSPRLAGASFAVAILVVAATLVLGWPIEKAALLAPVMVVVVAIAVGVVVFWLRVAWDSLSASEHRRWIVAGAVSLVALVAVLTLLGIELPRE